MNPMLLEMSMKSDEELDEIINNPDKYSDETVNAASLEVSERMRRDETPKVEQKISLPTTYKLAGFWLRFVAYIVDLVLTTAVSMLIVFLIRLVNPLIVYALTD